MQKIKRGQLVAVWGSSLANRRIRIFVKYGRRSIDGKKTYLCREPNEQEKDCIEWPHCVPLEVVEPCVFIGCDQNLYRNMVLALAKELAKARILTNQKECCSCSSASLESCMKCWYQKANKEVREVLFHESDD